MKRITYAENNGMLIEITQQVSGDTIGIQTRMINRFCKSEGDSINMYTEKEPVLRSDNTCDCSCGDYCPLHKTGMIVRCNRDELEKAGVFLRRKDL